MVFEYFVLLLLYVQLSQWQSSWCLWTDLTSVTRLTCSRWDRHWFIGHFPDEPGLVNCSLDSEGCLSAMHPFWCQAGEAANYPRPWEFPLWWKYGYGCVVRSELWSDADELDSYAWAWLGQPDGLLLWDLPIWHHVWWPGSHQHLLPLFSRCEYLT